MKKVLLFTALLSFLYASQAYAVVRMYVYCNRLLFDGTTLRLQVTVTIPEANVVEEGIDFSGLPGNVASITALQTAIKNRAIAHASSQHSLTITANDTVVFGGPQ